MKSKKLMLAVVAVLGLGAHNVAQADSIALAQLNLDNFKWTNKATGVALGNSTAAPVANRVSIVSGNNSANLSVALDGFVSPAPDADSVSIASGGQIPLHVQCIGPDCGSATTLPPAIAGTFAYASHSLSGAIIDVNTGGSAAFEILAGASAHATAESSLVDGHALNNGTSDLGTNTRFDFIPTADLLTRLSFDYVAKAMASVITPMNIADTATASIHWTLTLNDVTSAATLLTTATPIRVNPLIDPVTSAAVTSWTPTELNHTAGVSAGDPDDFYTASGTGLGIDAALLAGHRYTLVIGHSVESSATMVPEPAVPALIGAGLLAFGLQRKRSVSGLVA